MTVSDAHDVTRLDQRLDRACDAFGERIAVFRAENSITYAQFAERAAAFAAKLAQAGLQADEPVLVAMSNSILDLPSLHGAWKAGGVAVPVHRSAASGTVKDLLKRTGARFILNALPDKPLAGMEPSREPLAHYREALPPPRAMLEGAAWIVFTSGSTGEPKGVVHAHESYLAKLDAINAAMETPENQRVVVPLQPTFAYAQWVALTTLLRGGEVVLASPFRPENFLEMLADGATACAVVPTMLRQLRPFIERDKNFRYSGVLMTGGEVLPGDLGQFLRGVWPEMKLWDIFGLTETATSDFYVRPDDRARADGAIGRPAPGVDYRIDTDTGELLMRTPYLMRGYLDDPKQTAAAMAGDFFRTGDQAREREDGMVELTGRLKDLVNRGGNKIAPLEIERMFLSHPDVEQALATGIPDARTGESLHLLVVLRRDATIDADSLLAWASERLDRPKLPDRIHFGKELPTGRTGKADRGALRAQLGKKGPERV